MAEQDVITQAAPPGSEDKGDLCAVADLPETVVLSMRGKRFEVKRERLLSLPESILFGLSSGMAASPFGANDEMEPDVMDLDFSPDCFEYILKTIEGLDEGLTPVPVTEYKAPKPVNWSEQADSASSTNNPDDIIEDEDTDSIESLPWLPTSSIDTPAVLRERPSLIVLREDLDYYVLSGPSTPAEELPQLKDRIGNILTQGQQNTHVFNGLRNRDTLDSPEYHLMQMLVLAGLDPDQRWDFRDRRSRTSQILSLQMTEVKLPESNDMLEQIYSLQKLLLFWRKPAKKCWWDKLELEGIIVHVRRVWTLELSIVGLAL